MTAYLCCTLRRENDALRAALEAERQSLREREAKLTEARRTVELRKQFICEKSHGIVQSVRHSHDYTEAVLVNAAEKGGHQPQTEVSPSTNNKRKRHATDVPEDLTDGLRQMDNVHDVVHVGGSTGIPKVMQLVSDFFGGKELNNGINPDEAVAYGAAGQGFILTGGNSGQTEGLLLLGMETDGAVMKPIIKLNSLFFERTGSHIVSTISDSQTAMCIRVFEGESDMTKDCHFIGEFELSVIPQVPHGKTEIEIIFELDANSVLNVKAKEKGTDNYFQISVTNEKVCLRKADIERTMLDSLTYEEQDKQQFKRIEAMKQLENYMNLLKQDLDGPVVSMDIDNGLKSIMNEAIDDAFRLVNDKNTTAKEYSQQNEHLKWLYRLILQVIKQRKDEAKNMLQNYITFIKEKISDPKVTENVDKRDKKVINKAVEDAEDWMKNNTDANKEVYEHYKEEIECTCTAIMSSILLNSDNSEYSDFVILE